MYIEKALSITFNIVRLHPVRFFVLVLLTSCVGPYMLQYTLNDYKVALNYEHDSKIDSLKSTSKVYIRVIDKLNTNDTTKVRDDGFLLVPLVSTGGYKGDFTVTLGKSSVTPSFAEFVRGSLQTEVSRSGKFIVENRKFRSDYTLVITLIDCQISAQYHKDRIRYGKYAKENWVLKPVTGKFVAEVRIIENRKIIFEKTYSSNKSSHTEIQNFKNESEMNKKMMEDFAKTASLEIKEIIETVVIDVNEIVE